LGDGGAIDDRACLLDLIALLRAAPADVAAAFGFPQHWEELDHLVAQGATETVAIRLMGDQPGFMISRGAHDSFIASLALPALTDEIDGYGDSLVQAVATAIALAITALLAA
jgi:hypothetical protein